MSAKRRAKEGLLQAVGAHHATEDFEFDQKLRNFTDQVNHLQKVKDSMDLWVEAFDTFGAATMMLSESFKGFFAFKPSVDSDMPQPTQSPYLPVSEGFVEVSKKLNRVILPSVRQLFELRCLQPTASILALVGPIDALLQERKTVLLDFDSYRAKIEKEHAAGRDSRHPLVVKKAAKLDDVAKQLHCLQTTICASFVEFEKARTITMGPEFTAFVACFFHFSSYSTELSTKIVPGLPQIASSLYMLESFIGQSFSDLGALDCSSATSSTATALSTHLPGGVVLERSEYAGGGYGGYTSHSTIMSPGLKEETESEDETEPSTPAPGSTPTPHPAPPAPVDSPAMSSNNSNVSTLPTMQGSYPSSQLPLSNQAGNQADGSRVVVGPSVTVEMPLPPPKAITPRSALPVAQSVDLAANNNADEEDVPVVHAVVRPPKPQRPTHVTAGAGNRASSPVPAGLKQELEEAGAGTSSVDTQSYRKTINLARGSAGGGILTEEYSERMPVDPVTPPPKPVKPPKPQARKPVEQDEPHLSAPLASALVAAPVPAPTPRPELDEPCEQEQVVNNSPVPDIVESNDQSTEEADSDKIELVREAVVLISQDTASSVIDIGSAVIEETIVADRHADQSATSAPDTEKIADTGQTKAELKSYDSESALDPMMVEESSPKTSDSPAAPTTVKKSWW